VTSPSAPVVTTGYPWPIETTRLANGLRVVVSEDRSSPVVCVNLWYDVGSRHEPAGQTGFAHLFEHLMFEGSAHVQKTEHMRLVQGNGGSLNATTNPDRTNYFETMPSEHLELALWLEADRMGGLVPALTQETLDNQREVVKNERRQRYENVPYGDAWLRLLELLYPEGHPYHHATIGSMADLNAASLDTFKAFHQQYYAPNNCVLTVVGDAEPEKGRYYRSDHFEFAKQGVPALDPEMGTDFIGKPATFSKETRDAYDANDYHKPSDEVKPTWNLSGAVDDLGVLFELGLKIANGDKFPEWKQGTEFKAKRDAMLH